MLLERNESTLMLGLKERMRGIQDSKSDGGEKINLLGKFQRFKFTGNSSRNKDSFIRGKLLIIIKLRKLLIDE